MPQIRWIKSDFEYEKEEFRAFSKESSIPYERLRDLYKERTTPQMLYDSLWSKLSNTDSFNKKLKILLDVHKINTAEYDKPNSVVSVLDDLLIYRRCFLPIVVLHTDKKHNQYATLIAGNTRLCVCRRLGIQPKIITLDMIGYEDE